MGMPQEETGVILKAISATQKEIINRLDALTAAVSAVTKLLVKKGLATKDELGRAVSLSGAEIKADRAAERAGDPEGQALEEMAARLERGENQEEVFRALYERLCDLGKQQED